jgi:hypothetical protein
MQTRKLTNEEVSALLANVAEEWKSFWFSTAPVAKNLEETCRRTRYDDGRAVRPPREPVLKSDLACWVDEVTATKRSRRSSASCARRRPRTR